MDDYFDHAAAWDEGADAYSMGITRDACPFSVDVYMIVNWEKGWDWAKQQYESRD